MVNYVVVIPSYQRSDILKEKTLNTLIEGGVSPSKIHIFVANDEEKNIYEQNIPKSMYYKIIKGVKGINDQRKFIIKYFPNKTHIVSLDDDVAEIQELSNTNKLVKLTNVHKFFEQAFQTLKQYKLTLWGVYPTNNPFYMEGQKPITTNLKFIIGTIHGFINDHNMILTSHIKEKEDVENSIIHFLKDKGVLRFNHIAFKTKFKNPKGGLGGLEQRIQANKEAAEYLNKKYPQFTRIKIRNNGMYEIVLKPLKSLS
jgi:hypothetical protein